MAAKAGPVKQTDRFGVGNNFDALTFAPGNRGYGPSLFYYLRRDVTLGTTSSDARRVTRGQGVAGSNPAVPTGNRIFSNIFISLESQQKS